MAAIAVACLIAVLRWLMLAGLAGALGGLAGRGLARQYSLGALVLQLDALEALLGAENPDPGRSAKALTRARALAVDGLNEARRAVGSLRDDPTPLVDSLRQVVDTSGTGLLEITGTPRPVPSEAAVALRRTAQEGLTNAAKHAPGSVAGCTSRSSPTRSSSP